MVVKTLTDAILERALEAKWMQYNNAGIKLIKGLPASMPELTRLELNHNKLTTLYGLPKDLPNLERLEISDNPLKDTDGFPSHLPKVKEIIMKNDGLTSLDFLPSYMPHLDLLVVGNNHLTHLNAVNGVDDRRLVINLEGNSIQSMDVTDVQFIKTLTANLKGLGRKTHRESIAKQYNVSAKTIELMTDCVEELPFIPYHEAVPSSVTKNIPKSCHMANANLKKGL